MNINLNQINQNTKAADQSYQVEGRGRQKTATVNAGNGVGVSLSQSVYGNDAYKNQPKTVEDIAMSAEKDSSKAAKNGMVVMSNTLSDEDYKKYQESGGDLGSAAASDMVTIVDEIKVTLAEAGVTIDGYNDNLDISTIEKMTGNKGYAQMIAQAFREYDIPATEENVKSCVTQLEEASEITELSDGAKKYLLENDLPLTIDNLYKAAFSGGGDGKSQAQGFFAETAAGYYGKKADALEIEQLQGQMEQVIISAGMDVTEQTMEEASFLLEKGIPLTKDNLQRLDELNRTDFPLDLIQVANACADVLSVGLAANNTNVTGDREQDGFLASASKINEQTKELTDKEIDQAAANHRELTLENLFAEAEANTETVDSDDSKIQEEAGIISTDTDTPQIIAAKKQLVQIQLMMSTQANLKLMRMGVMIETEPLSQLLSQLEELEKQTGVVSLQQTQEHISDVKALPADVVGISVKEAWSAQRTFTLAHVETVGKTLATEYAKAQESYEALWTAPRKDLGDSISKAFGNIEDLLKENGLENTADNQRAVRILGYNQMEITQDNIDAVKEADQTLQRVLNQLTPDKTLQMIRDGVNPLETNMEELTAYLSQNSQEAGREADKYSRFLVKLEKSGKVTKEEKESYIGIYRMLRQIEKTDGAALGSLVNAGQEINFKNLLTAVRSEKKGAMDYLIDDSFGLLTEIEQNGSSISEQVGSYYQNKAANLADAMAKPDAETPVYEEEIGAYRELAQVSDSTLESLLGDGITVAPDTVMAQQALSEGGMQLWSTLLKLSGKEAFAQKSKKIVDDMSEGRDKLAEDYEELEVDAAKLMEHVVLTETESEDVRSFMAFHKQISLAVKHAKEENYYLPLQRQDESISQVHVKIVHGSDVSGQVSVRVQDGETEANGLFYLKEGRIEGLIGVSSMADVDKYREICKNCAESILNKIGMDADISCVYSKTTNLEASKSDGAEDHSEISSKNLYQIAKSFIEAME